MLASKTPGCDFLAESCVGQRQGFGRPLVSHTLFLQVNASVIHNPKKFSGATVCILNIALLFLPAAGPHSMGAGPIPTSGSSRSLQYRLRTCHAEEANWGYNPRDILGKLENELEIPFKV